jgi:hypothetical protein
MNNDLFSGTRTPRPPADLRERTLRAARAAAREAAAPLSAGWGFKTLDLVWVAALLLLVVANGVVTRSTRPTATASARPQAHEVGEERIAGQAADRDFLALGIRLDPGPRKRPEPTLSLEQVLRAGS